MRYSSAFLLVAFLVTVSCQKFSPEKKAIRNNQKASIDVIYEEDDRIDFFQILDPLWHDLAQSTVVLLDHSKLIPAANPNFYKVDTKTFGHVFHLCEDEPFFEQPTAGFCSGFLIGPDTVVTAGHCIRNDFNCENVRMAFGYHYSAVDDLPHRIKRKSVYSCSQLIHSETNAVTGSDYAILRLDRSVEGFSPLPLRTQGKLTLDDPLTVIGYPSGLPGKLAHGGKVRAIDSENFVVTTLDTYGGNSGSAVLNSNTGLVEGILVRGDTDFVFDQVDRCRRSNVCKSSECRGEDVVRIKKVFDHLAPSDLAH